MRLVAVLVLIVCAAFAPPQERPAHVSIALRVAPEAGTLTADTMVSPGAVAAGEELRLILAQSLTVHSAEAGPDAEVTVAPTDRPWRGLQRITVRFRSAQSSPRIRIRYSGRPSSGGQPPINMITPALVELSLDGMWVPTRDDLGMPYTVDATIAGLPAGASFVSQGRQSRRRAVVRVVRNVADVDFAFVAAPGLRRVRVGRAFELHAIDPDSPAALLYRRHGGQAAAFLQQWFGPMPGAPARLVVVRRERGSGYQRIGYIVFTEGRAATEAGAAKFTAHEFAHAWFRNANAASEHRWVDEATAEFVGIRYVEHALGAAAREDLLRPKRERARAAGPVVGGRSDAELYDKGTLLLFELEERIGRERMDRVVARVARERVARTEHYVRVVAEIAGAEQARWFDAALRS